MRKPVPAPPLPPRSTEIEASERPLDANMLSFTLSDLPPPEQKHHLEPSSQTPISLSSLSLQFDTRTQRRVTESFYGIWWLPVAVLEDRSAGRHDTARIWPVTEPLSTPPPSLSYSPSLLDN